MIQLGNYTEALLRDMENLFPRHAIFAMEDKTEKISGAAKIDKAAIPIQNGEKVRKGIYFTPNGEYANKPSRLQSAAGQCYCFLVDYDQNQDYFWEDFSFEPTVIIKTGKGRHAYWVLKNSVSFTDDWKKIQKSFVELIGGDTARTDASGMMRYPGTRYWKDNEGTKTMDCVWYNPEALYTFQQFRDLFAEDKIQELEEKKIGDAHGRAGQYIFSTINDTIDVTTVLHELGGGRRRVVGKDIYEDNKKTDGYKYWEEKNALKNFSGDKDGRVPFGGPRMVAKHFLQDDIEVFEYFKQRRNISFRSDVKYEVKDKKKTERTQTGERVEISDEISTTAITTEKGDIVIDRDNNVTVFNTGKGVTQILDCALKPVGRYDDIEGNKTYIVRYKKQNENDGYCFMTNLGRGQELDKILSSQGITFLGGAFHRKHIIKYVHDCEDEVKLVDSAGLHCYGPAITKVGRYMQEEGDNKYFVAVDNLYPVRGKSVLKKGEKGGEAEFKKACDDFVKTYKESISYTAFLSFLSAYYVSYTREVFEKMPLISLLGLKASGKTTIRMTLFKMFGIDDCMEVAADTTDFVIMKLQTHNLPIVLAESSAATHSKDHSRYISNLKRSFDGSPNQRGTSGQQLISYKNRAALIMDGQTFVRDSAVKSRTIQMFCHPSYRKGLLRDIPDVSYHLMSMREGLEEKLREQRYECEKEVAQRVKGTQADPRSINIYATLLSYAKVFGVDHHKELLKEQMLTQLKTDSTDDVAAIVASILHTTLSQDMARSFLGESKEDAMLRIVVNVDPIRFDEAKIGQLQSNVQVLNHHFKNKTLGERELHIPLPYLMENKDIETSFIAFLNGAYYKSPRGFRDIPNYILETLEIFGSKNNTFIEHPFMTQIKDIKRDRGED